MIQYVRVADVESAFAKSPERPKRTGSSSGRQRVSALIRVRNAPVTGGKGGEPAHACHGTERNGKTAISCHGP